MLHITRWHHTMKFFSLVMIKFIFSNVTVSVNRKNRKSHSGSRYDNQALMQNTPSKFPVNVSIPDSKNLVPINSMPYNFLVGWKRNICPLTNKLSAWLASSFRLWWFSRHARGVYRVELVELYFDNILKPAIIYCRGGGGGKRGGGRGSADFEG